MLTGDLFLVAQQNQEGQNISAKVRVNKEHTIFKGHFPGNPVVPGVCMIQLVKEVIEDQFNEMTMLNCADSIKFLQVWNPDEIDEVEVSLKLSNSGKDFMEIDASIFAGNTTFFKLSATLIF